MVTHALSSSFRAPWHKGAVAGLSTLALGFGVMNLFWHLGKWDSRVPGLWDYRSATVGDGILLPFLSGALVTEISKLPRVRHEVITASSLAATGIVTGWLVVRSWLSDPLAGDNWTQANGVLNSAGTYHLVFLMGASGMFAALFGVLALRLLASSREQRITFLESRSLRVIIVALIGFTGMTVIDNIGAGFSTSNLMSVVSVVSGSALVLFVVTAARRRAGVADSTSDFWAIANAVAILVASDVIVRKGAGAPGFAMVVALCVSTGAALDARYRGDRFWAERMFPSAVILWAGMSLAGAIDIDILPLRALLDIALIGTTVLLGATVSGYWKWGRGALDHSSQPNIWRFRDVPVGRSVSPIFALISIPVIWGALANLLSHDPEVFGKASALILGVMISLLGARMANIGIRYYGEFVIREELLRRDAWMKWAVLISFASAVLFSLFWVVAQDMLGESGHPAPDANLSFLWIVASLSVLAAAVGYARTSPLPSKRLPSQKGWLISFILITVTWGATPWIFGYSRSEPSELLAWSSSTVFRGLVALYLSVGFGLVASRSIYQNGLRLQLCHSNRIQRVLMLTVFLAVGSVWFWMLAIAMWKVSILDHWRFFVVIGLVYLSTLTFSAVATHLTHQCTLSPSRTLHPPWRNSIQDALLFGALTGFSYFAFRSLGTALEDFSEAVQEVNTLLGFGFPLIIAYLYKRTLGNNDAHLKTMRREIYEDEVRWTADRDVTWTPGEKREFIDNLELWIGQQKRLAQLISPSIPIMLLWKQSEENDLKQSFKHVTSPGMETEPSATPTDSAVGALPEAALPQ